ncbi:hypothetical protein [Phormidium sp. FACHB-1136]|uniref:hypothetical protein n=1 Tax=Phormidium sp. FACHB-1136 TaxID=2692848 RepID=UPI001686D438|nr:hypothetical protein [Phormidium sp. FACHB-1136]MBD2427977.1 hypothetical protein [Phormidium sp. FACHB-1136]
MAWVAAGLSGAQLPQALFYGLQAGDNISRYHTAIPCYGSATICYAIEVSQQSKLNKSGKL